MNRPFRYLSFLLAGATSIVCFNGIAIDNSAAAETVQTSGKDNPSLQVDLVDTGKWLRTVDNPPQKWREAFEQRTDVLRSRFVRFRLPDTLPSPRSSFVIQPFKDVKIVLHARRGGVLNGNYTWSGEPENDLAGWGNFVFSDDQRIAVSIVAHGRRFKVANINPDENIYAVLELTPPSAHRCELHK